MRFKKQLGLALILGLLLQLLAVPAVIAATETIQVIINGEKVTADPAPIMIKGRVMVPIRLVEKMQAKVYWDEDQRLVTVNRGLSVIQLWAPDGSGYDFQSQSAIVNGKSTELDAPPVVVKGRVYVPLRLIAEGLGAKVSWDKANNRVNIDIPEIMPLTGLAKTVRDAAYNTFLAQSMEAKLDVQFKIPEYPQLNVIKIDSKKDKTGRTYAKGHFLGYNFEALQADMKFYVKGALFNDKWVGLDEFGPEGKRLASELSDLQNQVLKEQLKLNDSMGDILTEFVRVLGDPQVVAEENLNGVMTQKIEFKPNWASYQELQKLNGTSDLKNLKLVVWIDKEGQYLRKIDFYVEVMDNNQTGWIQLTTEYSSMNGDFTVTIPDELIKK